MKKTTMRAVVPSVLAEHGFENIRVISQQGVLRGARLLAVRDGHEVEIAVKATLERAISFTKQSKARWRTASAVDLVVAVVPAPNSREAIEVHIFESKAIVEEFDKAWKALQAAGRSLSFEIPIFIPLDKVSRKNVGHDIADLKARARPMIPLNAEEIKARSSSETTQTFYDRVKQEFADKVGVDVSKVEVEFRIKP
jgi:hypothetical protein